MASDEDGLKELVAAMQAFRGEWGLDVVETRVMIAWGNAIITVTAFGAKVALQTPEGQRSIGVDVS